MITVLLLLASATVNLAQEATSNFHLAPPGAHECDYGQTVSEAECEDAAWRVAGNSGRSLQVGGGGRCLDTSWGQVPLGCSAQTGGDKAAHFKTSGDTGAGCINKAYQLVCTNSGLPNFHLAAPGAHICDYGQPASETECEGAALSIAGNPKRSIQVGRGGGCMDGSWGQVPLGCSAQTGGDKAAHFKTSGDTGAGCINKAYQLVCTTFAPPIFHLAPPGAHKCDYGHSATQAQCEDAAWPIAGNPKRSLQVGRGGGCMDGSWGQVPLGCSAQTGGDKAAHFKTSGDTGAGCINKAYQLVCTNFE